MSRAFSPLSYSIRDVDPARWLGWDNAAPLRLEFGWRFSTVLAGLLQRGAIP